MAYWLARTRNGQDSDFIPRFEPRFWTVDFPRPMMASVVSTAPDALRVECEFHHHNALAGLIWESEDRHDHPLLAYDTDRDYSRTTLSFRWRSSNVLPLDAVHGPTLTIEGRDIAGNARSWYVRLWHYASGSPQDATITLNFSALREGWYGDGDQVHPLDIDRMFISIAPIAYSPGNAALLASRVNGWVELSRIACDGDRAMLAIGDVMVPPHDVHMATAYDDSYHLAPARLVRTMIGLGYRGAVLHYIGMSHYYRLAAQDDGSVLAASPPELCTPCSAWHLAYLAMCEEYGLEPILSFSFELLNEHCPESWKQRAFDGSPALTGWEPPSTLLSPASNEAFQFLHLAAERFVALFNDLGMVARMQIGEPWWWVNTDGQPCLYDAGVYESYFEPQEIADLRAPLTSQQIDFVNWAGRELGSFCTDLRDRIRSYAMAGSEVMLLAFTPTILDPQYPELHRANLPDDWASPAFDRFQLEDYDWLTGGAEALRKQSYELFEQRLAYPRAQQDYLAGFVRNAEDAEANWRAIDAGLDEASQRGVSRRFVWAMPQIIRDGYTRLPPPTEEELDAFDDVLYPLAPGRDAGVSPEFSTSIMLTASGHERRSSHWTDARLRYDVGPGIRSEAELGVLLEFFRARRGAARGFRLFDPFDHSSSGLTGAPDMTDQLIGTGDGLTASFQLTKTYGGGDDPQMRPITRPRAETLSVSVGNVLNTNWVLEDGGILRFLTAPPLGAEIRAGFLFDVPVRFAEDRLDINAASFSAGEAPSVPLLEIREAV